jgi:Uma2 family endonuclease
LTALNAKLKAQNIAWAFPELRCTFCRRSIVPDVAVFTWERISFDAQGDISDDFVSVPDWTIEILSPEQSATKVTKKILHCLQNGCRMGWLVDPDESSVFVYQPKQEPAFFDLDAPQERLPVPDFAARHFELTVGALFGWLKAPKPNA